MRLKIKMFYLATPILALLVLASGCSTDDGVKSLNDLQIEQRGPTSGIPVNTALIGLTPTNELVNLMSGPPAVDLGTVPITGMRDGEIMLAIDTRPRTKELFGVSNLNTIFKIDPITGAATAVGPEFTPGISGEMVGFDFNPADDRIRIITNLGQNLRIDPVTGGVVSVDVPINSFTAALNSVAYSYNLFGQRSTLFAWDIASGSLYKLPNPNAGFLQLVGSSGFNFRLDGGFEISSANTAFTIQFGSSPFASGGGGIFGNQDDVTQDAYRLYSVNLRTAQVISYGKVREMIGIAVK